MRGRRLGRGGAAVVAVGLVAVTMGASSSALTPAPTPVQPVVALPAGPALSDSPAAGLWSTNGRVADLAVSPDGRYAYLGGAFDYLGPTTGHAVTTAPSPASGAVAAGAGWSVDGAVTAAVSDGSGGWYLGGSFARVGGVRHLDLAHVLADGTVDAAFTPAVTGSVSALALTSDGSTLVVGGRLSAVRGSGESTDTAVTNLTALDTTGARVAGWSAPANGAVAALAAVGDRVYVGGSFTSLGGAPRTGLARVAAASGALDPFAPAFLGGGVRALAVQPGATRDADVVHAGGDFTSVRPTTTAVARTRLAAVSGTGALLAWTAAADASVASLALAPDRTSLLVGGAFTQLGGFARAGFGRLTATPGAAAGVLAADARLTGCHLPHGTQNTNTFYPCALSVQSVAWSPDGQTAYLGGNFTRALGTVRHDAAALAVPTTTSTGSLTAWAPMPSATVSVVGVAPTASTVLLGGDLQSAGGVYRRGLARVDLTTGAADGFAADVTGFAGGGSALDGGVLDLELDASGTALYVGGYFAAVRGVPHAGIAKLDATTGAVVTAFTTSTDKGVQSLAVRGGSVYLGGAFTQIGTTVRQHAAKVSSTTGAVDASWKADATGPNDLHRGGNVFSLAVTRDASKVFLAGGFTAVNGSATAGGIIAVNGSTGAILPNRLGGVVPPCPGAINYIGTLYLSPDDQRLYGGDICPDFTYQWDAVNLGANRPQGLVWRQWCNAGMQAHLEVGGIFYYGTHGGDAGKGGYCAPRAFEHSEVPQQRVAAWRASDGMLLTWAPFFDSPMGVWTYAVVPGTAGGMPQGLLVGGDFTVVGDRGTLQQGLALLPGTP